MQQCDRGRKEKENVLTPSSPEHTPVYQTIYAERKTDAFVSTTIGRDMDVLDNIQGPSSLNVNVECSEEKPWRKTGADISDYFNYGFDEESWNTYCKNQVELRAASRELDTSFRVQPEHTQNEEDDSCCACSSSYILASSDVNEGQAGYSVEGQRCLSGKGNSVQVAAEIYPVEDRIIYQLNPLFNFHPLPPSLYQHRTSPVSSVPTSPRYQEDSYHRPCAIVPSCLKALASHSELEQSREKRPKQRDTAEPGHRCHRFEGVSGVKDQNRAMRHKNEGSKKSSHSSRRRRDDGEDRESQSRHKHKKAKRKVKDIN